MNKALQPGAFFDIRVDDKTAKPYRDLKGNRSPGRKVFEENAAAERGGGARRYQLKAWAHSPRPETTGSNSHCTGPEAQMQDGLHVRVHSPCVESAFPASTSAAPLEDSGTPVASPADRHGRVCGSTPSYLWRNN
jgi:hypothetical protein